MDKKRNSTLYINFIWGVLKWGMVGFLLLTHTNGCASTNQDGKTETHYPLIDTRLRIHKYKENIQWMIFPKHNTKLTQYCSVHFEWEDIQPLYRKVNEEMKWVYRVNKNKKSWK